MSIRKPSAILRSLSYVFPVRLYKKKLNSGKNIIVQLYKGQYQLAYGRVFYSDGHDYFPIKKSLQQISIEDFEEHKKFLCLGSGVGSLSMVLHHLIGEKKHAIDYVEINNEILELCKELTQGQYVNFSHDYILADANVWMRENTKTYDVVIVDIFEEHIVPIFVFKKPFIRQLYNALDEKGFVILNMMFQSEFQQHEFEIKFSESFPKYDIIHTRKNKIYIARK